MDLKLAGSVVMVTGGGRGLGRELAYAFAGEGAKVAIVGRSQATLDEAVAGAPGRPEDFLAIQADLSARERCDAAVAGIVARFGRLDVLVNNASTSITHISPSFVDLDRDQLLERVMGKAMTAIHCSQAAVPHMRAAGGGRIVNIGGTAVRSNFRAGERSGTGSMVPQGLGNAALANFTKLLADEVAGEGILANIVHPHVLDSIRSQEKLRRRMAETGVDEETIRKEIAQHVPIGRMVRPSDVVPLVLLLSSPVNGGIAGQSIAVDGGALRSIMY